MKQHYLAVMKSLTEKLAMPSKPLSEILGEMMAEAGPMISRQRALANQVTFYHPLLLPPPTASLLKQSLD